MIISALSTLGLDTARVNERHDIGIDRPNDTGNGFASLKISGSAYKLTRQRALHHCTLLLKTEPDCVGPNLKSPALPCIKAKGMKSVNSAVVNVLSEVALHLGSKLRVLTRLAIVDSLLPFTSLIFLPNIQISNSLPFAKSCCMMEIAGSCVGFPRKSGIHSQYPQSCKMLQNYQ